MYKSQKEVYAYVTLVMNDTRYVAGAVVLAESLRKVRTEYLLYCMVDKSIPQKDRDMLARIYDYVVEVPIIEHDVVPYKSEVLNKRHGGWIRKAFTKWNAFDPQTFRPHKVTKVLFVDSDMIFLENCDEAIFSLPAPAAMFASKWIEPYKSQDFTKRGPFGYLNHGDHVRSDNLRYGLQRGHLGDAGMVLLRPNKTLWNKFNEILFSEPVYGENRTTKAGPDEQILIETLLALNAKFYAIHQIYNWPVGKNEILMNSEMPKVIHYQGPKPWVHPNDIEDVDERNKAIYNVKTGLCSSWTLFAKSFLQQHPDFLPYIERSPLINGEEIEELPHDIPMSVEKNNQVEQINQVEKISPVDIQVEKINSEVKVKTPSMQRSSSGNSGDDTITTKGEDNQPIELRQMEA